jgi:hypothetical protein
VLSRQRRHGWFTGMSARCSNSRVSTRKMRSASYHAPIHGCVAHLDGLIHVAHVLRLHIRVLLAAAHKLGERRQQALDAYAAHICILTRYQGCGGAGQFHTGACGVRSDINRTCVWAASAAHTFARLGHDGGRQNNHFVLCAPAQCRTRRPARENVVWGARLRAPPPLLLWTRLLSPRHFNASCGGIHRLLDTPAQ